MVFSALLIVWIILNGRITLEILCFGVLLCVAVVFFLRYALGYTFEFDKRVCRIGASLIKYAAVLFIEIVKANLQVVKIIVTGKTVQPRLVRFTVPLNSETAQVALADSITLTPGTITVQTSGGELYVHALDEAFAGGLDESCFVKQLVEMEGKLND